MADNALTYDEFKAFCLRDIPTGQHEQWLAANTIEPAPILPAGWVVVPKAALNQPDHDVNSLDSLQDYEHTREIE